MRPRDKIGITSTVPVEIIYAAGCLPYDLNNVFISQADPQAHMAIAERLGMPRNTCTWVKGIYSTILTKDFQVVVGVVQGDCTNVVSMLETLLPQGLTFIPFAYPYDKNRQLLRWEIQKLMDYFKVQWDDVVQAKSALDPIRKLALEIDYRTWKEHAFTGQENFYALVNCTDFKSDPLSFRQELKSMLMPTKRIFTPPRLRLGLLGVPGVFTDLYDYLEKHAARIIYHEIARQFAMPAYTKDLLDQYLSYTYPYCVEGRLRDILEQTQLRGLDGYIHYVQSFCHHQIEDVVMRKRLPLPVLTLEGERVGPMDGRTRTRLDAFLNMLLMKKRRQKDETRY